MSSALTPEACDRSNNTAESLDQHRVSNRVYAWTLLYLSSRDFSFCLWARPPFPSHFHLCFCLLPPSFDSTNPTTHPPRPSTASSSPARCSFDSYHYTTKARSPGQRDHGILEKLKEKKEYKQKCQDWTSRPSSTRPPLPRNRPPRPPPTATLLRTETPGTGIEIATAAGALAAAV